MKDVAELAGVSLQTVSAVVNEKQGITLETRKRVLHAVEELGYRPFSIARSLRTRRTRTIALVISDIANPSFATMASAAERYTDSLGYSLVLYNTHDDAEREASYIAVASERWVDGVLLVAAQDRVEGIKALDLAGIPSVAIDRIPQSYTGPSVTLDNLAAGRLAAEHLLDLGHTMLAHISGPLSLRLARERQEGFRAAVERRGLSPCFYVEGSWECDDGYRAMQTILASDTRPTAIFAANDRMAIGAARALVETGLCVPQDVSVVGLDNIEISAFQNPPLTTIQQSFEDLATSALQLLFEMMADREPARPQLVLQPRLIVRASTRRIGQPVVYRQERVASFVP
jgi:DNA-binding LacI/PurR family transcriptional regulator